ncbi:hypothetical protein G7046_g7801 [Stylonectria norvegica]|nr:hypothetical protein G7046_g7801 [Stylonectria norvegica]
MSASAGVQGYENLGIAQQRDRGSAAALDNGVARQPSATPSHLSRVLYIPLHNGSEFHLQIQDVSAEYKHCIGYAPMGGSDIIGDALMGSRLFITRLGTMKKPKIDIKGNEGLYAIDSKVDIDGGSATVSKTEAGVQDPNVTICVSNSTVDFKLVADREIDIIASFPVPDTTSSVGTARHPFFTFTPDDNSRKLQWQTNPATDGPLRYTLVELEYSTEDSVHAPKADNVRAIYHHIGQGPSLSMRSSEGVLLLPEDQVDNASMTEGVVLASLIGLLWRVRGIEVKPHVDIVAPDGKQSFLQRLFKKD